MRAFPYLRRCIPLRGLATLAAALLLAPAVRADDDPWGVLAEARQGLAGSARTGTFEQTYVPQGFSSGEREEGRVWVDLPGCARWDYAEPFPRSYLLCGSVLRSWNQGESVGQLFTLDEQQAGLDLLLLAVDDLRSRYDARIEKEGTGRRVRLSPKPGRRTPLTAAELLVAADGRLSELAYRDREGNVTRFRFSRFDAGASRAVFQPPTDVRWERAEASSGRG